MEYHKIISVTGFGGLFELVGSKSDGAIVRSLEDKSTKFVSSRVHNFSHLESIEIFTEKENANLVEVLKAMDASEEKLPDEKDPAAVRQYFEKVYPQIDFERVYASDTKKIVRWFKILKENNIEFRLREAELETEEATENAEAENNSAEASDKKEAPKEGSEKAEDAKAKDVAAEIKKEKIVSMRKQKEEPSEFVNIQPSEEKPKKKVAKKSK